jgi:hypothetical protein
MYFLFDGIGPMDGEFYADKASLFSAMNYAPADAQVGVFDPREFCQGSTSLRSDLTEELVLEAYDAGTLEASSKLAGAWVKAPQTAADVADAWRDERAA